MAVLILYETIEGQTGKIVDFVEAFLKNQGEGVRRVNTSEPFGVSFQDVERVVLAAPVHERRHPRAFETCIASEREALRARKTLMLSVSLKAAFKDGMEDAQDFLTEMEMRTKFQGLPVRACGGRSAPAKLRLL